MSKTNTALSTSKPVQVNYSDNNSDYLEKACKYGQITG